jgi:hypothetical protein
VVLPVVQITPLTLLAGFIVRGLAAVVP